MKEKDRKETLRKAEDKKDTSASKDTSVSKDVSVSKDTTVSLDNDPVIAEDVETAEDIEVEEKPASETEDGTISETENIESSEDITKEASTREECIMDEKKKNRKEKKEKKDKKDQMIEELTDKYKRTFAEFENFRKRSEREKSAMYEIGAKDVVDKMLPIVDNFERALMTVSEEDNEDPFIVGMDKIYKQLLKTFEDMGVKPIESIGNQFDPNLHNAVMHIEDESYDENVIIEEFQKGYKYRESVIRHSMVKVAN